MGFCEVLTLVFVVLKLTGNIDWSWWLVLLPEIIAVGCYLVLVFVFLPLGIKWVGDPKPVKPKRRR